MVQTVNLSEEYTHTYLDLMERCNVVNPNAIDIISFYNTIREKYKMERDTSVILDMNVLELRYDDLNHLSLIMHVLNSESASDVVKTYLRLKWGV